MTAGAEGTFGVGAIFSGMLRHGLNYNRWVAADWKYVASRTQRSF
jgi:hypothetical protein